MKQVEYKKIWQAEETAAFQGWDFSYLTGRMEDQLLPWDYEQVIRSSLKPSDRLLDMGTGGGEFLLTLNHPHENTAVTEAYPPNIALCEERLASLGITVKGVLEEDQLPFADNTFDIILNRHEAFFSQEIARVLKPDGIFITQQVGGKNNNDLSYRLISDFQPAFPENTLENAVVQFRDAGFTIQAQQEYFPYLRFYDVGALVYFAKIIQWEFPDFSVERCFVQLLALQTQLEQTGYIQSTEHRFLLVAKKGNA